MTQDLIDNNAKCKHSLEIKHFNVIVVDELIMLMSVFRSPPIKNIAHYVINNNDIQHRFV